MKIGILSDTHYPDKTSHVPDLVFDTFRKERVELILHAGDLTSRELKGAFEDIAPMIAVRGNLDMPIFPEEQIVKVEDMKIGLIHGHQFLSPDSQVLKYKALEMGVDLLIFGHTHRFFFNKYCISEKDVMLLNPGSPTVPRRSDPTFIVGEIKDKKFNFKIFKLWETGWRWP